MYNVHCIFCLGLVRTKWISHFVVWNQTEILFCQKSTWTDDFYEENGKMNIQSYEFMRKKDEIVLQSPQVLTYILFVGLWIWIFFSHPVDNTLLWIVRLISSLLQIILTFRLRLCFDFIYILHFMCEWKRI